MLEEADLVLTICPRHIAELRRLFGDSFRARALPEHADGASAEEGSPPPTEAPCPPTDLPYASSSAIWIFSWTVEAARLLRNGSEAPVIPPILMTRRGREP